MGVETLSFWIWVGLAVGLAGLVVLRPLWRNSDTGKPANAEPGQGENLAFLRAQIAELNHDFERGLIEKDQFAQAEAEIGRRILTLGRHAVPAEPYFKKKSILLAGLLAAGIPVLTVGLYLVTGAPGVSSQPFQTRTDMAGREYRGLLELADTLEGRLAGQAGDIDTWIGLAETRSRLGQYDLAQYELAREAYRRAVPLAGKDRGLAATLMAAFAESLILADQGGVSDRALQALDDALRLNPAEPRARYYKGLALLEAGDIEHAAAIWRTLAADSPTDAPWLPSLRQRLAELEQVPPGRAPAIDEAAVADMMDLSADERAQRIAEMVESLRARLELEPNDRLGWLRLANAYGVMDRAAEALEALGHAAGLAGRDAVAQDEVLRAYFAIVPEAMAPQGAESDTVPRAAVTLAGQLYATDPQHRPALWVLAAAARKAGEPAAARGFLKLLVDQLPEGAPERRKVEKLLEELYEPPRLLD